jgi:S-adenosylhomocysteine hydrolase
MQTIKIKSNELEYSFSCLKSENEITYYLFEDGKLINKAVDTGNGIDLNSQLFSYHDFAEMYLFLRAIKKTDNNLMGEYIATTETKLFDL